MSYRYQKAIQLRPAGETRESGRNARLKVSRIHAWKISTGRFAWELDVAEESTLERRVSRLENALNGDPFSDLRSENTPNCSLRLTEGVHCILLSNLS